MALLEPLYRVSEICADRGIENVVICPGSRSAALTLAFVRNKKFRIRVITDERSAAFVALGWAQASGKATVLICTSGTAALNFSPAVAEAYFQGIPLLVLTADRPPEWINQHDGQTIFQQNIYGRHIVKAYEFPADYSHPDALWMIERQTHEALAFTR
ncbi:MAG: 2-succinyl-5-enolpyruvyl-6-hydroxy-3-cyclohexene-1-carboxylic-acid synthase, partial [Leadbetterella sp.]|nr:2-succinyl-5-enolpyruvyl-6-hydroxy-3-cyclohexene-1-carboxylic-acid synthase [Leadbetterella sp.]